jgi:riboflavin synthase
MFTGIITDIGVITSITRNTDATATIRTAYAMDTVALGASIACGGVCLTVVSKGQDNFTVNISGETLSRTTLGSWQEGTEINLERSLKLGDELGGHLVSGHVDGVAHVREIMTIGDAYRLSFDVPGSLGHYLAEKGSVTLDGVSLTVNGVEGNNAWVTLIPHTWHHTTMQRLRAGSPMNLEIDMLARYVERMLYRGARC